MPSARPAVRTRLVAHDVGRGLDRERARRRRDAEQPSKLVSGLWAAWRKPTRTVEARAHVGERKGSRRRAAITLGGHEHEGHASAAIGRRLRRSDLVSHTSKERRERRGGEGESAAHRVTIERRPSARAPVRSSRREDAAAHRGPVLRGAGAARRGGVAREAGALTEHEVAHVRGTDGAQQRPRPGTEATNSVAHAGPHRLVVVGAVGPGAHERVAHAVLVALTVTESVVGPLAGSAQRGVGDAAAAVALHDHVDARRAGRRLPHTKSITASRCSTRVSTCVVLRWSAKNPILRPRCSC